jgi:flavin-dependent dehydrogenase
LKEHSDIRVERGVLPEELKIDDSKVNDTHEYPITVKLRHLDESEATPAQNHSNIPDGLFRSSLAEDDTDAILGKSQKRGGFSETIQAKYVIGADGAHSWTRRNLGITMEGEQTDYIVSITGFLVHQLTIPDLVGSTRCYPNYRLS